MPHVDEGTLHALLDGALRAEAPERDAAVRAHLAQCEDCRARLEAAEELRGEAAGILAAVGPVDSEPTPDFSDVVARAADHGAAGGGAAGSGAAGRESAGTGPAGRDGIRRRARRLRAVAWAASLVLALGTGYLLRDLAGPGAAGNPFDAVRSEATADRETAGPRADDPASLQEEAPSPADGATTGRASVPETVPPDEAADARALRETPAPQALAPAPSAEAGADGEAARAAGDPGAQEGAGAGAADAAAPPPPPAPPPTPRPEPRSAAAAPPPGESAEEETGEAADRKAADLEASAADLQTSAAVASARGERGAPAGAAGDSVRWSAISLAEARAALDGPLFVLPRADLLEIYILAGGTPARVMTLQRLQTGIPVRVAQWPGGEADLDVSEAAAGAPTEGDAPVPLMDSALPGAEVARVIRGGYVLELTGSLPRSLLAVLGETARPAP